MVAGGAPRPALQESPGDPKTEEPLRHDAPTATLPRPDAHPAPAGRGPAASPPRGTPPDHQPPTRKESLP
jgi:hypothetical protein